MFSVVLNSLLSLIAYLKQLVSGGWRFSLPHGLSTLEGPGRVIWGLLEHSDPREDLGGHIGLKHMILLKLSQCSLKMALASIFQGRKPVLSTRGISWRETSGLVSGRPRIERGLPRAWALSPH